MGHLHTRPQAKHVDLFPTAAQALSWCRHLPASPCWCCPRSLRPPVPSPPPLQTSAVALEGAVGLWSDPTGCQGPQGCFQGCIFYLGSTAGVDLNPPIWVCQELEKDSSRLCSAFSPPVSAGCWDAHRGRQRDLPAASHIPGMLYLLGDTMPVSQ